MAHAPHTTRRIRFPMNKFVGGAATVVALLVVCTAAALPSAAAAAAAATAGRSEVDAQPDWSVQSGAAHARPWRSEGGDSDSNSGNSQGHGAAASLRVGYTPLRTFHAVRGAGDFGAARSALFDLPHPSTFVATAVQMGEEEEEVSAAARSDVDAEFSLDSDEGSISASAFAGGSTGRSVISPRSSSSVHTPTQFDTIRDSMLHSQWMDDTRQSSSNSMAFLRNFPRRKMDGSSGSNQLQRLGGPFNRTATSSAESDPIGDYLASMFFMYGVPLFFAMLAIVVWAGFCVARCWCNLCGRHATVLYTDKQVRLNYVLVVLLIIIMGVCAAFGWTGNVRVSQGLDKGFAAAHSLLEYGKDFVGVASTAYEIGYSALILGISFNQTMALVPPPGLLNDSALCVEDSHLVFESQAALVASLTDARAELWGSAQERAALDRAASGVGAVRAAVLRLATPLPSGAPVPAGGSAGQSTLHNLQQQLHSLNASLSTLPNATALEGIISHLSQVQSWSAAAQTLANLTALVSHFGSLDAAAATLAPALTGFVSQGLGALEQGVAALAAPLPTAVSLTASDDASRSGELVASYDGVLIAFNTSMPRDFPALLLRFQEMRDAISGINATLPLLRASLAGYRLSTGAPWPAEGSGGDEAVYAELSADLGRFESFQQVHGPALASMLGTDLPALMTHLALMRQSIPEALASLNATRDHLQAVQAGPTDPAALAEAVRGFNETAGRVECFLGVLALLQETNATLVILPSYLSSVHERLLGPLQVQVASMETLRHGLARAAAEWDAVNATLSAGGAPDFDALASALTGLNATLNGEAESLADFDFEALWSEILPLALAMQATTGADGVEVSWAAPVWTIQPGDENATASYPTAQWGSVEGVSPRAAPAGGFVSALSGLVGLPNALNMTAPLGALEALVKALEAQLGGAGLSATLLERHAQSLASFAEAASTLPSLLRAALPLASTLPLPLERREPLVDALNALSGAVASRPPVAPLRGMLGPSGLNGTLASPQALSERAQISLALRGLHAGLEALPSLPHALRHWHSNATATGAFPTLQDVLAPPGQMLLLQAALDSSAPGAPLAGLPAENEKLQSMHWSFNMTGVSALLSTLDPPAPAVAPSLTVVERDAFLGNLSLFHDFASHFPDFDAKLSQGRAGLAAIGGALEFMEETQQLFVTKKADFKSTIDNYDGVRLLIFNLGVILPFILSFLLLLAAIQHYGCPAMVAGLTFFPLFVLFMCMSAIQMPVSVALSDHCYNSTGEIKIQTDGRSYPASKLAFFNLASDIDVPSVVDYFTECKGATPELLVKLRDPLPILRQQGLESAAIQAAAREGIGLDFAEPLASDFRRLDALQVHTIGMFNKAVSKLNCTSSSSIYHAAMEAVCTDFGPAFALTTCVFLLTAVCMVPGVCIGITSYKRFNPVNRDAAYTKARGSEDQHVINDPSVPEGWN